MKTEEVPQDLKYYKDTIFRDVTYAVDNEGRYRSCLSDGWEVKTDALDLAWSDVNEQCEKIRQRILRGETSPLEFHAVKNLMNVKLLSAYTGFSKRTIRKHFRPEVFSSLSEDTLQIYADVLRITVDELKRLN